MDGKFPGRRSDSAEFILAGTNIFLNIFYSVIPTGAERSGGIYMGFQNTRRHLDFARCDRRKLTLSLLVYASRKLGQ